MADPTPPADGLGPLLEKVKQLERRLRDLETPSGTQRFLAVDNLVAQQAEIVAQQTAMAEQILFLQSQTVESVSAGGLSGTRAASGGITLDSFDGTYDISRTVVSSGTGKLLIQVGAQLGCSGGMSALVGFEATWAGGSIAVAFGRCASSGGPIATVYRASVVTVPANTPITIKTRRGWTGATAATCWWAYQSLIVTKIGQ